MECLEQLDNFDINSFSDIDDYLKPINTNIKKDFVDSLTNLSKIISNGIVYVNFGIYENLKQTNDSQYTIPKECKILNDVVTKGTRRDTLRQCRKLYSDSSHTNKSSISTNNSIDIVVTDTDGFDEEEYFGMDQSMIKPHHDFNFNGADSSLLFDQSAIFSNLDLNGDGNVANQSMIFMDSHGKSIFSNDNPANRNTMYLNINGLTADAEGNNNTYVNLTDMDNNYLSTSDNESNNSTAYWDDLTSTGIRIPAVNDPEEYLNEDEDDQFLIDEFNQAFASKKFASVDTHDLKYHGYGKQNKIRHTYPNSSAIQVNHYQIYPDQWNEMDEALKKQGLHKTGLLHKKLYPVVETPYLNDSNSSFDYSPSSEEVMIFPSLKIL